MKRTAGDTRAERKQRVWADRGLRSAHTPLSGTLNVNSGRGRTHGAALTRNRDDTLITF